MDVFEKIETQRRGREGTDVWMVGQQLIDICRVDKHCAQIVAEDLENPEMGLHTAAKQIKAYADKQPRKENCVCVPPDVAESIIRKFYCLPEVEAGQVKEEPAADILDLSAFI